MTHYTFKMKTFSYLLKLFNRNDSRLISSIVGRLSFGIFYVFLFYNFLASIQCYLYNFKFLFRISLYWGFGISTLIHSFCYIRLFHISVWILDFYSIYFFVFISFFIIFMTLFYFLVFLFQVFCQGFFLPVFHFWANPWSLLLLMNLPLQNVLENKETLDSWNNKTFLYNFPTWATF